MLDVVQKERTLCITLDRPDKGNSLSVDLVRTLTEVIEHAGQKEVLSVVIQGRGRHFCTGFDLSDLDTETDDTLLSRFVRIELLLQAIYTAPFQTMAIAQGRVTGAGADIFTACQQRYLVEGATLAFPGAAFGLVLGTGRLARCAGTDRARDWVLTGRQVTCDEALSAGLAHKVLDPENIQTEIEQVIQQQSRLDTVTRQAVMAASRVRGQMNEHDLHNLVCSAARPGIKQRIQDYRASLKR